MSLKSVHNHSTVVCTSRHVQTVQVVLWVYTDSTRLYIINIDNENPIHQLHQYIEVTLGLTSGSYTLGLLYPGCVHPEPVVGDLDQGVVVCMPAHDVNVHILHKTPHQKTQSKPAHVTITLKVSPLQSISEVKAAIQKEQGHPEGHQELLYDGHVMLNHHRLLDYSGQVNTKVHLLIQPDPGVTLNVITFWGCNYQLEVTQCQTVQEIIDSVVRKAGAELSTEAVSPVSHQLYNHLMVLECDGETLDNNTYWSKYQQHPGATATLVSAGEAGGEDKVTLRVLIQDKVRVEVTCYVRDTWFVGCLRLHGKSGTPVRGIKLLANEKPVQITDTIGRSHGAEIDVRVLTGYDDSHSSGKFPILCKLPPDGVEVSVMCCKRDTVRELKGALEAWGFKDAQYYQVYSNKTRLINNTKLATCKLNKAVEFRLDEFPVSVTQGVKTITVSVQKEQTMSAMLTNITGKFTDMSAKLRVLYAGRTLSPSDKTLVKHTSLQANSKLFTEPSSKPKMLHLVTERDVIPIATGSSMDALCLQQLHASCQDVGEFLELLEWFKGWRFPEQAGSHSNSSHGNSSHKYRLSLRNPNVSGRRNGGKRYTLRMNAKSGDFPSGDCRRSMSVDRVMTSRDDIVDRGWLPVIIHKPTAGRTLIRSGQTRGTHGKQRNDSLKSVLTGRKQSTPVSGRNKLSVRFEIPDDVSDDASSSDLNGGKRSLSQNKMAARGHIINANDRVCAHNSRVSLSGR